jgi:phage tail sheath protein FI
MATYLHPGVYIEEVPSGSRPIDAAGTSVAAFLGTCGKGVLNEPVFISSWDDYIQQFGGIRSIETANAGDVTSLPVGDRMGLAVRAFFQNGGSKAYVVRLGTPKAAKFVFDDGTVGATALLTFSASESGTWAERYVIRIVRLNADADPLAFSVEIGTGTGDQFQALESFTGVSEAGYVGAADMAAALNDTSNGSKIMTVTVDDGTGVDTALAALAQGVPQDITVVSGTASDGTPSQPDYAAIFNRFVKIRDINIIMLPEQEWASDGSGNAIIDGAISHCEHMKNRMVIVDPPHGHELVDSSTVTTLSLRTKTYAALYYPWVKVANPFYSTEESNTAAKTTLAPPCGFAAGLWAKTDSLRGVWKAPSGVQAGLLGTAGLEYVVEDAEQDFLNPAGVNAFRTLPNYGQVIWGSRTLATRADPEWRYVPVRRTAMFIEESIFNGIQWAVFEPNDHRLWSSLRVNIESFMDGLFRVGAFQGQKASDAYFVKCGLGQTMTQDDIDAGKVIVLIGFAPLKPAEFVIVRIQQIVEQK